MSATTFYATLVLDGPSGAAEVDARPSDALNLALTTGAPIRANRPMVDVIGSALEPRRSVPTALSA